MPTFRRDNRVGAESTESDLQAGRSEEDREKEDNAYGDKCDKEKEQTGVSHDQGDGGVDSEDEIAQQQQTRKKKKQQPKTALDMLSQEMQIGEQHGYDTKKQSSPQLSTVKNTRRHSIIGLFPDLPGLRKRKRKLDDDTISLQSFDSGSKRSLSFKVPSCPTPSRANLSPYKAPLPSPGKRRLSRTWSDMVMTDGTNLAKLSHMDIKRQEAIYELYQGEVDLIEDLNIVKKTYRDSLQKLQLMTEGELQQIFGPIDNIIPLHEDLVGRLQSQKHTDGTTHEVGKELEDWVPTLSEYISFCANQVFGKALLDEKKNDPDVDDFLQRCQDSPFSRKLDLWGLLDGARGRFMKYPLLLRSILKYTSKEESEIASLARAVQLAEEVVAEADKKTGEAKCVYYRSRITYLYDDQRHPTVESSTLLLCNGTLKSKKKGSKLQLFLFDQVLVLTQLVTQNSHQCFQVYRDPIPVSELVVEDLKDGEVKMGSFRSAFGSSQTSKNLLRVSFRDSNKGQSHTLMSHDEHDKRQWLTCFNLAMKEKAQTTD